MVRGSNLGRSRRFSLLKNRPDRLWGPPDFLLNNHWSSFPGMKQLRREGDHDLVELYVYCREGYWIIVVRVRG
jgi:hypothetical protein